MMIIRSIAVAGLVGSALLVSGIGAVSASGVTAVTAIEYGVRVSNPTAVEYAGTHQSNVTAIEYGGHQSNVTAIEY
ncbi:MAG TPA: hypothetical protein VEL03_16410 [Streptosporangiaceae bacterium]|nr:hypothetical protein [Streptosporangiaceae bacterium]